MFKNKYIYILLILLVLLSTTALALPINWTISSNTSTDVDFINESYAKPFFYALMLPNGTPWSEYPIMGMFQGLLGVYDTALAPVGGIAMMFIALYFVFVILVWKSSGNTMVPGVLGLITAGAWGMFIPSSAFPYALILFAAALAAFVLGIIAKDG
jgi:hypothetical protein